MPTLVYNGGLEQLARALAELDVAALDVMLVNDSYVVNRDHTFVDDGSPNDPASHEITLAGYTRQTLANKVLTRDDANDMVYLDADDALFGTLPAGETIGGAVLLRNAGGADAANPLIAFYGMGNTPTRGVDVTVRWNAPSNGGVLKLISP